jgi:hypothetical protein
MDTSQLKFAKPQASVLKRHQKRKALEQALEECYAEVDARDAGYCWVTGRYTQSGHVDARIRREHHHLEKRSQSKARRADPDNVITTCAEAHALIEAGLIQVEGEDASKPIRFHWTLKPSERPFQIKSRRWSQNREES